MHHLLIAHHHFLNHTSLPYHHEVIMFTTCLPYIQKFMNSTSLLEFWILHGEIVNSELIIIITNLLFIRMNLKQEITCGLFCTKIHQNLVARPHTTNEICLKMKRKTCLEQTVHMQQTTKEC